MTSPHGLRFALCDDEHHYTSLIEGMLTELGHEVVGVAATAADGAALIEASRPDVVIFDLSMDFNSDFDVMGAAEAIGAAVVIFSQRADELLLNRYEIHPTVVYKPDLVELQRVVVQIDHDGRPQGDAQDRRRRPTRATAGPVPTSVADSQAFYEALNEAAEDDSLLAIELVDPGGIATPSEIGARLTTLMRTEDRLLVSANSIRVFLPGGDTDAIASFLTRIQEERLLPDGATVRAVVIASDESPVDVFARLRTTPPWPLAPGSA